MTSVPNNSNVYLPGVIQIPSALEVVNITRSNPMVMTVTEDPVNQSNSFQEGQLVRISIPFERGMQQANGLTARILFVDDNDLFLEVNSTNFDPFISGGDSQTASISPAGARNLSFSNITNNVPFQSLNNVGN